MEMCAFVEENQWQKDVQYKMKCFTETHKNSIN